MLLVVIEVDPVLHCTFQRLYVVLRAPPLKGSWPARLLIDKSVEGCQLKELLRWLTASSSYA